MKRILPCLFAVALLGAACGSGTSSETGSASTDASTGDVSAATDSEATPTAESDAVADTQEPAADPAGVDWPLSFSGETVDGSQFDSGDYTGQDLVLWFWAPW